MTDPGGGDLVPHRPRRGYLDWLRGLAVLIMIEAHVVDSWTGGADRQSAEFGRAIIVGGMGAPLFLFLAGVSVALSAGSKQRRTGDAHAASRAVVRRGLEIFGLAFLFRVQAWILGWGPVRSLLKVDILNIMGPAIMAAAWLWGSARTSGRRYAAFVTATLAMALLTPIVRTTEWIAALPDPIEGYLRPVPGLTNFVLFPWAGFVFAGTIAGLAIDNLRSPTQERRLNILLLAAGLALTVGAYGASHLPSPYAYTYFWTSSPSFFFLRVGLMTAAISLSYAWASRPWSRGRWSPMQQLGRTSLFIYWIHVELVYGLISRPLHQALTLRQVTGAFIAFTFLMLLVSLAKSRIAEAVKARQQAQPSPSAS
jgi:uncharacterized membrane protein